MPVGKSSLTRAAESAAAAKKKKPTKIEKPATDVEAMPIEVAEEGIPTPEPMIPEVTPEELALPNAVGIEFPGVVDPMPELEHKHFVAIGDDLPIHLL
ncbi:MAG: hypothetical protein J6R42_01040 [Clostridia bacterium]|nr:hypothetical protein [Clostridia bacterium]